jgi:hypothetical protein
MQVELGIDRLERHLAGHARFLAWCCENGRSEDPLRPRKERR